MTLATAIALNGCGPEPPAEDSPPADDALQVVATTTQIADFVRAVGGDKVTVTQLLKPNASPHEYEPTPAAIDAIGRSTLMFKNGVGLEGEWLDKIIRASGFDGETVDTSRGVPLLEGEYDRHHGHEDEEEHHAHEGHGEHLRDPHIWHNPQNAKLMSENIGRALIEADPGHKAHYRDGYTAYGSRLDALDKGIERRFDAIPEKERKFVTTHDAFGYYVERYNLTFVGAVIPDFSDQAELSGAQLDALVGKIKDADVRVVFGESSLPPKAAQSIAREAGVQVVAGENALYSDALGQKGSPGETYLKAMEFNTDTIVEALS
ncbi:metal ABC transporter substrate-binding protein [Streptomyces sp. DSM 42041]|uniref:Metal ABC transporter substrate-binding protein n=1 Tax=Streptomyces hazeniae TaxID=3075538 RepID=A0ABU2P3U8_9ACTN|nr:metal ABC transporter substrate-binding protein [Streptomyces sp. DSM 42041]MDT0382578.1 metal ABC transporter substrate-binding protein [Streptomyces sp. DSM 42041]